MGIIKRQTIYGSVYSYLGVLIGFITTGILFPNYLATDEIGLINMLIAYSTIFAQFASLGFNNATFRLFTYFRNPEKKHNGFLFLALSTALVGFILAVIIIYFLKPYLTSTTDLTPSLLNNFYYYIIPLTFFVLFFNVFDSYYTVLYNATIGTFLKELLLRVFILLALVGFIIEIYLYDGFVKLFTISYFIPLAVIFLFLYRSGEVSLKPKFGFLDRNMVKTLTSVSLFGILSYTTDILVFNIDRIMIERFIGLSDTGIYSTAFFFGMLVMIPSRSLFKISTAVIADAWKNNDHKNLSDIYKKSCINQFLIGVLIFLLLIVNLDNIMQILPKEFSEGKYVIVLISLAMLANMAVGVNNVVIMTSREYRMNTYLLLFLSVMLITLNFILIPEYGIIGAAIATLASKVMINLARAIYVKWKFNLQPYNYKFILIVLLFGISFLTSILLPVNENFIVDIIIRSCLVAALFGLLSYFLKISDEFNNIVHFLVHHFNKVFKR
jgi:O-antigen/teichoic acid export membrane protein